MKIRRLQQRFDDTDEWENHGYAYAREDGRAVFVFNPLTWEYIGSKMNTQLKKNHTPLEKIETVIPTGERLRWLEIEEIEGDPEEIKATLDKACKIPRPRRVSVKKPVAV